MSQLSTWGIVMAKSLHENTVCVSLPSEGFGGCCVPALLGVIGVWPFSDGPITRKLLPCES